MTFKNLSQREDGWYDGEEWLGGDRVGVAFQLLGWCGCGMPEAAAKYLVVFHNDHGAAFFAFYALDQLGLTEHGGGVGASWLSGKGQDVLEWLELALAEEEQET